MDQVRIGSFISECRKNKGLTQEQLACRIGVTSKSISRWENGNTMPDYSLLKDLCSELGISVNELLSGQRIEDGDYMSKAEENFISLKRNVDRTLMILNFTNIIVVVFMIALFLMNMYFNFLYNGSWDDSGFSNIIDILLYISIACSFLVSMLKYEVKK